MRLFNKHTKPASKSHHSRVSGGQANKKFRFRWWMALILIVVVGGVGIAVLRFSRASVEPTHTEIYNRMKEAITANDPAMRGAKVERYRSEPLNQDIEYIRVPVDINSLGLINGKGKIGFDEPGNFISEVAIAAPNTPQPAGKTESGACFLFRNQQGADNAVELLNLLTQYQRGEAIVDYGGLFEHIFDFNWGQLVKDVAYNSAKYYEQQEKAANYAFFAYVWVRGEYFECSNVPTYKFGSLPDSIFDTSLLDLSKLVSEGKGGGNVSGFIRAAAEFGLNRIADYLVGGYTQNGNGVQQYNLMRQRIIDEATVADRYPDRASIIPNDPNTLSANARYCIESVGGIGGNDLSMCSLDPQRYIEQRCRAITTVVVNFENFVRECVSNPTLYFRGVNSSGQPTTQPAAGCVEGYGQICATVPWRFLGANNPVAYWRDHNTGIWQSTATNLCGVKSLPFQNKPKIRDDLFYQVDCNYAGDVSRLQTPATPPPPPTCNNGVLKKEPTLLCDDGQWVLKEDVTFPAGSIFAGKRYVLYVDKNNAALCATRSGNPVGSLAEQRGYMYPANCNDIQQLKVWAYNAFIADLGRRAFALQDVYPFQPATKGKPINTNSTTEEFGMKRGNMVTYGPFEKPNIPNPPYYGYPNFFLPEIGGLYSLAGTTNFFGNVWGYVDGQFVAASNYAQYKTQSDVNGFRLLSGPYENPGGNTYNAGANGRKLMRVCWTIKDLLALQTNNTQHSRVYLKVISNGGSRTLSSGNGFFTLSGTDFNKYCHENIRITQSDTGNLEYTVNYYNGSIAISKIEREFYWPSGNYEIKLPTPASFSNILGLKDPVINQLGVNNKYCFTTTANDGCLVADGRPLAITSSVFNSVSSNGKKQICVKANGLLNDNLISVDIYGKNSNIALATLNLTNKTTLWDFVNTLYCTSDITLPDKGQFDRLVLSSSVSRQAPVLISNVYINNR